MFNTNKEALQTRYSASYSSLSGINHAQTNLTGSNGEYFVISMIEDTVIIAATAEENAEKLDRLLDDFGY